MATFVISKRFSGLYKYELVSRKGKTIFTSNSFELRFECEEEIEYIKRHLSDLVFMKFKSGNGKFFFKIILNQKELATSRKYSTQLLLQKGIDEITRSTVSAETLDFSTAPNIFDETA